MTRFVRSFTVPAAAALAAFLALAPASGQAQSETVTPREPVVAIIDMQYIMSEATAVQSIQEQIERQRVAYQAELTQREQELRSADEELSRQRTILSEEAFNQRRQELEQRIAEVQREVEQRRRALDSSYNQAMQRVQTELVDIVGDFAEENNVDIVLSKAAVVIVRSDMEITLQALEELNRRIQSVDVPEAQ